MNNLRLAPPRAVAMSQPLCGIFSVIFATTTIAATTIAVVTIPCVAVAQQPATPTQQPADSYTYAAEDTHSRVSTRQVLRMTMQYNPTLQASVLELRQANENVRFEEGRNPYTLQLEAGVTRSSMPRIAQNGYETNTNHSLDLAAQLSRTFVTGTRASLRFDNSGSFQTQPDRQGPTYGMAARATVSHPFMRGSGTELGEQRIRIAKIQRTTAELSRDRAASEAARDVLVAYWELWYAETAINIEQSARDLALRQRNEAQQRVDDGALAPVEVLPFETRLAGLEESVTAAHTERRARSLTLSQRIGNTQQLGTGMYAQIEEPPNIPSPPPRNIAIEQALAQSPEIRELEGQLRLAQEQLKTSGDAYRPRLDLEGYVQVAGLGNKEIGPMFEQVGTANATSVHVGLVYELPLDGSQQSAERTQKLAAVNIAEQRLLAARQRIQTEVDNLLERQRSAKVKLELAKKTTKIAEQQVAAETERFQIGVAIAVQVQQAEDELRKARLRMERAKVDLAEADVQLHHATGQLLGKIADDLK